MKKLLWKPSQISWKIHVLIAIIAVISLVLAETFKADIRQPYYVHKIRAARIMRKGIDVIKKYRIENDLPINEKTDPMKSGLIGILSSHITSKKGDYDAKLTSINPNWAAVIVSMMKEAKVRDGSTVAVSFSGSFPAINLAVLSAARAMNLKLIIFSSVSASTWGANIPEFTWLDMEQVLYSKRLFPYRSTAASYGGIRDRAIGMDERGKRLMLEAAKRNGIPFIDIPVLKDDIDARMELFLEKAGEIPIAMYINVGGGITAVGSLTGKKKFKAGLNIDPPRIALTTDSIMTRFAKNHVPVIFLTNIKKLAEKHNLPIAPKKIPKIGEGKIYVRSEYNRLLILAVLGVLTMVVLLFIRMGIGYRLFSFKKTKDKLLPPQHMV